MLTSKLVQHLHFNLSAQKVFSFMLFQLWMQNFRAKQTNSLQILNFEINTIKFLLGVEIRFGHRQIYRISDSPNDPS